MVVIGGRVYVRASLLSYTLAFPGDYWPERASALVASAAHACHVYTKGLSLTEANALNSYDQQGVSCGAALCVLGFSPSKTPAVRRVHALLEGGSDLVASQPSRPGGWVLYHLMSTRGGSKGREAKAILGGGV